MRFEAGDTIELGGRYIGYTPLGGTVIPGPNGRALFKDDTGRVHPLKASNAEIPHDDDYVDPNSIGHRLANTAVASGEAISQLPFSLASGLATLVKGGDARGAHPFADVFTNAYAGMKQRDNAQHQQQMEEPTIIPGVNYGDIQGMGETLGTSLATGVPAMLGGAATVASGPLAPFIGPVVGGALTYNAAHRTAAEQLVDSLDKHFIQTYAKAHNGKQPSLKERNEFINQYKKDISDYGNIEGIGETLGSEGLGMAFARAFKNVANVSLPVRLAMFMGESLLAEVLPETEQQLFEGNIEHKVGLPGAEKRDPTSFSDQYKSFKEVLPQTAMLSALGIPGVIGGHIYKTRKDAEIARKAKGATDTHTVEETDDGFVLRPVGQYTEAGLQANLNTVPEAPEEPINIQDMAERPVGQDRRQQSIDVEEERRVGDRRVPLENKTMDQLKSMVERLRKLAFTNPTTKMANRNALEDTPPKPFVASIDVNGLKFTNDNLGHAKGDEALNLTARALEQEFGDNAFHISGDEFIVLGNSQEELNTRLEKVKQRLATQNITGTTKTGHTINTGVNFEYAIGETQEQADALMEAKKDQNKTRGLPTTGTHTVLPEIIVKAPKSDEVASNEVNTTPTMSQEKQAPSRGSLTEENSGITNKEVYHATDSRQDFSKFKTLEDEIGVHVGTQEQANARAKIKKKNQRILKGTITLKNPLRIKDTGAFHVRDIVKQIADRGILTAKQLAKFSGSKLSTDQKQEFINLIKRAGYDGFVYLNRHEGVGILPKSEAQLTDTEFKNKYNTEDSYILLDSDQFKNQYSQEDSVDKIPTTTGTETGTTEGTETQEAQKLPTGKAKLETTQDISGLEVPFKNQKQAVDWAKNQANPEDAVNKLNTALENWATSLNDKQYKAVEKRVNKAQEQLQRHIKNTKEEEVPVKVMDENGNEHTVFIEKQRVIDDIKSDISKLEKVLECISL